LTVEKRVEGETMTIALEDIVLAKGNHPEPNGSKDGCLLEWASYLAGEPWSDHPECVSPTIAAFSRRWNDDLDDEPRQVLRDYLPRLLNTRGTHYQEIERYWMVIDWMIRVYLPAWLDLAGLTTEADSVRRLPKYIDAKVTKKSQPTIDKAKDISAARKLAAGAAARAAAWDAAWDAAGAAAWDAAGPAVWDAAGDAARAAARDAAGDAAWDAARAAARAAAGDAAGAAAWNAARAAARDAARAAAWDAAGAAAGPAAWDAAGPAVWDALRPTTESLQVSALQLLDDLIAVTDAS
jgi:hypothetical protein